MKLFVFLYSIMRNKNIEEWMIRQGKDSSLRSNSELVWLKTGNNCKCWALCNFKFSNRQDIIRNITCRGRVFQFADVCNKTWSLSVSWCSQTWFKTTHMKRSSSSNCQSRRKISLVTYYKLTCTTSNQLYYAASFNTSPPLPSLKWLLGHRGETS